MTVLKMTPTRASELRTFVLWQGLCIQIDIPGCHITDPKKSGGTCYALVKREYGLKGTKERVLTQLEDVMLSVGNGTRAIMERRKRKYKG